MKPSDRIAVAVATAGGIGFLPVAPGTFGSLPGLVLAALLSAYTQSLEAASRLSFTAFVLVLATAAAWLAIARAERALATHDDQRIVIDEVVGQMFAAAFLPLTWPWYGAAFVLFRLLDVAKPGPIGRIDREAPGALGTLGDDVLAGIVAGVILSVSSAIF